MSSTLVYSTDGGDFRRVDERKEKSRDHATDRAPTSPGKVRVGRETQGRKGKGVTVVTGLSLGADALEELAADLKRLCGSGGTVRDGVVEIQGDHRDRIVAELEKRGIDARRSGG